MDELPEMPDQDDPQISYMVLRARGQMASEMVGMPEMRAEEVSER